MFTAVFAAAAGLAATETKPLAIGDAAPALIVKWVKGDPIAKFENDKVYLLEFWATWCGPCRAVMPHLSELAKKHKGKVEVIGVNVYEKGEPNQPYETFYPQVKKFVGEMGNKMAYRVAMDTNKLHMAKAWMEASAELGIPTTFLVKDSKVIWIGHPSALDKVLEEVLSNTYDVAAFAKTFAAKAPKAQAMQAKYKALSDLGKDVESSIALKDYPKALAQIEAFSKTADPEFARPLTYLKLRVLAVSDPDQFIASTKELAKSDPYAAQGAAGLVIQLKEKGEKLNLFAIGVFKEILSRPSQGRAPDAVLHNWIGTCFFRMGRIQDAIQEQELAVTLAREVAASGKVESVTPALVKDYENTLAQYKAGQAK